MNKTCVPCPMSLLCYTLGVKQVIFCVNTRRMGVLTTGSHRVNIHDEYMDDYMNSETSFHPAAPLPVVPKKCPYANECAHRGAHMKPCKNTAACTFGEWHPRNVSPARVR
jgi:hypothetical protein